MKNSKAVIFIAAGILLVAGAAYLIWANGNGADTIGDDPLAVEATQTVKVQEVPTKTASTADSGDEMESSEIPQGLESKPTPRPELEGTDPGSVKLASGGIQLIEIFAFW